MGGLPAGPVAVADADAGAYVSVPVRRAARCDCEREGAVAGSGNQISRAWVPVVA